MSYPIPVPTTLTPTIPPSFPAPISQSSNLERSVALRAKRQSSDLCAMLTASNRALVCDYAEVLVGFVKNACCEDSRVVAYPASQFVSAGGERTRRAFRFAKHPRVEGENSIGSHMVYVVREGHVVEDMIRINAAVNELASSDAAPLPSKATGRLTRNVQRGHESVFSVETVAVVAEDADQNSPKEVLTGKGAMTIQNVDHTILLGTGESAAGIHLVLQRQAGRGLFGRTQATRAAFRLVPIGEPAERTREVAEHLGRFLLFSVGPDGNAWDSDVDAVTADVNRRFEADSDLPSISGAVPDQPIEFNGMRFVLQTVAMHPEDLASLDGQSLGRR